MADSQHSRFVLMCLCTRLSRTFGFVIGLIASFSAPPAVASEAQVIISDAVQNGGFESEVFAPWLGGERVLDPLHAPGGRAYAKTTPATVSRSLIFRYFPAVAHDRRNFLLTFKARVDSGGFQTMAAGFYGNREDGSFLDAAPTGLGARKGVSGDWETYLYLFQFPEAWDLTRNMQISFGFYDGDPGDVGYLDDVRLVQLPLLPAGQPILITSVGDAVVITFEGTLQMTEELSDSGSWTDVDPAPVSPWLVPDSWRKRFFRVKNVP